MTDFLVHFVNTLDPNGGSLPHWPVYSTRAPKLMGFVEEKDTSLTIIPDTFREEQMQFLTQLGLAEPL